MITYNYFGEDQKVYYEKLENGLDIYIVPNAKKGNYYIELVTRYGSSIKEFNDFSGEVIKLPLGVAHFLEHKIFDTCGEDPFSFYSKTGTYVNAGTNYFCTKYYIEGKKKLKSNLDYFLNMVYTPFIKKEKVESEKEIIAQEIKMYDDEPEWILDYEYKRCLFSTTVCEKIAGNCDSIKLIDEDLLKKTYEVFYQPSNMFLVACGNVNPKEIINVVKNNSAINNIKSNMPIIYKKVYETKDIPREYKYLEANIVVAKLAYSYKFDLSLFPFDYLISRLYLNLLFTYLFGDTSDFSEKVMEEKIAVDFYMDHLSFDNIYAMTLEAESDYADVFKEIVDNTVKNIDIKEEEFNRIKKTWISIVIRSLDNKENLAYSIVDDLIKDGNIYDQYELINKINYSDLLRIISLIDWNNKSFVLMMPKEK